MMRLLSVCSLTLLATAAAVRADSTPAAAVEFNREIRPILSDNCFQCHGPDKANRKSNLRLDSEASVFEDRGGYRAVEPGSSAKSELVRRIQAPHVKERMPPASTGRKLSQREITLLRRW